MVVRKASCRFIMFSACSKLICKLEAKYCNEVMCGTVVLKKVCYILNFLKKSIAEKNEMKQKYETNTLFPQQLSEWSCDL